MVELTSAARRRRGVGVEKKHQPGVSVAKPMLHGPGVDAVGHPLGGGGVPEPVEGKAGSLDGRREDLPGRSDRQDADPLDAMRTARTREAELQSVLISSAWTITAVAPALLPFACIDPRGTTPASPAVNPTVSPSRVSHASPETTRKS